MSGIDSVLGREVLDSRGNPTVEVEVLLESGAHGRAIVPSGASTGQFEARRAPRRRCPLRRQGRAGGRRARERRDRRRHRRATRRSTSGRSTCSCATWTAPRPSPRLGANALLGVSLAVAKAAAEESDLPLFRYVGGANASRAARADDERAQRGRARRQQRRPAGVHGHARRRSLVLRGASLGRRDLPRPQVGAAGRGLSTAVGDEGGFAPEPRLERGSRAGPGRGDRATPGTSPGVTWRSPSTRRAASSIDDGAYVLAGEGRSLSPAEMAGVLRRPGRPVPDRVDRGRHGRGGLGRVGRAHRVDRRSRPARRRRPVRHQHRASAAGHRRRGSPTRSS